MIWIGPHEPVTVSLRVDGTPVTLLVEPRVSLADALREQTGSSAVRVACEQGVCGSCTVLVDGESQRSCLLLAVQAADRKVETLAGLAVDLEELRSAFSRHFALQCGFCAPGVLVTAAEYLDGDPDPDEVEVRRMLSGNVCRCTGYEGMVQAIVEVAAAKRSGRTVSEPVRER